MVIVDMGSGETCRNDPAIVKRMIDELAAVDSGKENVVIKWQLFEEVPAGCAPLKWGVFRQAYEYALSKCYFTTASVFDERSLEVLLNFNVPFVKVACRPELYKLIDKIPPDKKVFVSIGPGFKPETLTKLHPNVQVLRCVPEYPAQAVVYETSFGGSLYSGISDHTTTWYLREKYQPLYHEVHYRLEDSTGLDSGPYARTPAQLKEIL